MTSVASYLPSIYKKEGAVSLNKDMKCLSPLFLEHPVWVQIESKGPQRMGRDGIHLLLATSCQLTSRLELIA